jgi:signal transduction histidine kinase
MSPLRTGGRVDITGSPDRGGTVLVRVVDNGAGMSPEIIRRAGKPGFTTRADGTGMGLHAVRHAVARIGGDLTINSTPGEGTEVQLRLPAATHFGSRCP